jgi:hypothetical protein
VRCVRLCSVGEMRNEGCRWCEPLKACKMEDVYDCLFVGVDVGVGVCDRLWKDVFHLNWLRNGEHAHG